MGERCWTTSCNKSEESFFESLSFLLLHGFQWTHVSFLLVFIFLSLFFFTLCHPLSSCVIECRGNKITSVAHDSIPYSVVGLCCCCVCVFNNPV